MMLIFVVNSYQSLNFFKKTHKKITIFGKIVSSQDILLFRLIDWLIDWLISWIIKLFIYSFVRSFVCSFVRSFVRSFVGEWGCWDGSLLQGLVYHGTHPPPTRRWAPRGRFRGGSKRRGRKAPWRWAPRTPSLPGRPCLKITSKRFYTPQEWASRVACVFTTSR